MFITLSDIQRERERERERGGGGGGGREAHAGSLYFLR